ncbi:MAG: ral secretion pathway protein [Rhodocyclaceae bacterium]|nr:ral secretion pathway protein [Rhodocyclaceae bacterium]
MQKGFSLIELMVVVAVIGILAGIAYPNYTDYVMRSKITEATAKLSEKRVQMEQYFQDNRQYANAATPCTTDLSGQNFNFVCNVPDTASYTITATGRGSMTGFVYSVNQLNGKRSVITNVPGWNTDCAGSGWVTTKGGAC